MKVTAAQLHLFTIPVAKVDVEVINTLREYVD